MSRWKLSEGPDKRSQPDDTPVGATINQVRRKLKWDGPATVAKDIMAAVIGLFLGAALVLVIWPDEGTHGGGVPTVTVADARASLCEQYILRDKKARYRYQREEYLLSEVVNGNRSRIDYGTLVNHLAKDDWDSVRLVGEVGVGKSTMVKRVAARFCLDTQVQVVRINLDEISLGADSSAADAVRLVAEHLDFPLDTVRRMRQGRLVLLLDGIDRLPSSRYVLAADFIKAFIKPAVDVRLVLISKREIGFFRALDNPEWVTYELPPLTQKESRAYLKTQAKEPREFEAFESWLAALGLDSTFEQPGLGTPSAVYLSTYDDATIVWKIFKEHSTLAEMSQSISDLYLRFIVRSVKARDEQLPSLAKVQLWLDEAIPSAEPGGDGKDVRLKWTLANCEAAAGKHGLPEPAAHCEHLFARSKGGLQFAPCGAEEACWTLSYPPHDDLFRARRLAQQIVEAGSCERVRTDLMHNAQERPAMTLGQTQVRRLCLPLLLQAFCQAMSTPEQVAQHLRSGFPKGQASRVKELGRLESENTLSGCSREVIKRLLQP